MSDKNFAGDTFHHISFELEQLRCAVHFFNFYQFFFSRINSVFLTKNNLWLFWNYCSINYLKRTKMDKTSDSSIEFSSTSGTDSSYYGERETFHLSYISFDSIFHLNWVNWLCSFFYLKICLKIWNSYIFLCFFRIYNDWRIAVRKFGKHKSK